MTSLGCNVTTCGYNDDHCCCRTEIDVQGAKAEDKSCTCCASFDRSCDCKNAMTGPKDTLSVHCQAANCVHNEDNMCVADYIDIQGANAGNADQTICASFVSR
jgi:hypothetical protein